MDSGYAAGDNRVFMESILKTGGWDVLVDPDRVGQPDPGWFDPDWWRSRNLVTSEFDGRGRALAIAAPFGDAVLRVYRRGGLVRHVSQGAYVYLGLDRVRSFHEWRLLRELRHRGLPVPEPLAAACQRSGLVYRAALLTAHIAGSRTLADRLVKDPLSAEQWARLGQTLARFAQAGAAHADLNARNVLMDRGSDFWVVDFDRAVLHPAPIDGRRMIRRLIRSLDKLGLAHDREALARGAINEPA